MISEGRKMQLREAQRRRREKLTEGERSQVNIYLTKQSKELVDNWCREFKTDRHELLNSMILSFSKMPNNIPLVLQDKMMTIIL